MKRNNLFSLFFVLFLNVTIVSAQQLPTNATLGIQTLGNAGQVFLNDVIDVQVQVSNNGSNPILGNKVRTQLSLPIAIVSALSNAQQTGLPPGWIITSNTGGVITICNGSDVIPPSETRTALIKIQGNAIGGPSIIQANLQFGPGTAVCTGLGTLPGDLPADNGSTSSVQVLEITAPLTLTEFNVSVNNCKPTLNWVTENEENTLNIEIEKSTINSNNWNKIGVVNAQGFSSLKTNYTFADPTNNIDGKVLYRLKLNDRDGKFKYSHVLSVFGNCNKKQVSIFPNPVQDGKLNISISGFSNNPSATLKSINGQLILTKTINNGTSTINVGKVKNGVYTLTIIDNKGITSQNKIIIQN